MWMYYNKFMDNQELPTPELVAVIPHLPINYDEDDERCVAILNQVATFCGKTFTEVPPDPDDEEGGGDIMPLDDTITDYNDKNGDGIPDVEEPGSPAEPYPENTDELDKKREVYKYAKAKRDEEKSAYWTILWQVIRLISDYTCWTEDYRDTFILQHRYQVTNMLQLPYCSQFRCNCRDKKPITIDLYYAPLDPRPLNDNENPHGERMPAFIDGKIDWMDDMGIFHSEPITSKYLQSHYNPHTEQINLYPSDFKGFYAGKCVCPEDMSIMIHYNAGYLTIPEAILPLICQMIGRINDSKLPLSECAGAMTQVSGLLKSKKVGNVQYTWSDNDTELAKTQSLFTDIYNIASMAELNSISRCEIINIPQAGMVV